MELNQPADQVIAVEAKFNLTSDQEIAMRELRKLRADMWDRNVPFDGKPLRQAAAAKGYTTKQQYVDAAKIDNGYARIAVQRGAEVARSFSHTRPYNSTCSNNCGAPTSATWQGKGGYSAENIHSTASIGRAMRGWGYEEVPALVAANGVFSPQNGHLYSLINPANTRMGFAGVVTAEGEASVARMGSETTGAPAMSGGLTVLHRPANGVEKPSTTPKKLILGGAGSSASPRQIIEIISIVLTVLSVLQWLYQYAEPQIRQFMSQFQR